MQEKFISVQRTARYHVLGDVRIAKELWIVLHGYGHLARYFLNHFDGLVEGRCIVAPEGLNRFYLDEQHTRVGATWMTREDRLHEIDDQITYMDLIVTKLQGEAGRKLPVHVLGFSQGVAVACRWRTRGKTNIDHMVLWAGSIPPELEREDFHKWSGSRVDLVLGNKDEYAKIDELDKQSLRFEQADISVTTHVFNGGHKLDPVTLSRLFGE